MFYLITYALTSLGTFGIMLLLSRQGFEAEEIADFRGLAKRSPWYAFVMLLLMFSLAGVPPTVGFYAKLVVLQALFSEGATVAAVSSGGDRGALFADRGVLLPAHRENDVLRRADTRIGSDSRSSRPPTCAWRCRSTPCWCLCSGFFRSICCSCAPTR